MATTAKSPRRGRSSLGERSLNHYDDQNLTLPLTRGEKDMVKQHQHASGKKPMFARRESSVDSGEMSPGKARRRSMQPRKSILKAVDFTNIRESQTLNFSTMASRRVSFAHNAHVRMFNDPPASRRQSLNKPAIKHSISAPILKTGSRTSLPSTRRASLQHLSNIAGARFITEGEGEGEASMEISDEEESDMDESEIITQSPKQRRQSRISEVNTDEEDDGEADMEETNVYGAGMIRRASVAQSEADVSDMSIISTTSSKTDEECTMDFTVALGRELPVSAPANAARNRQSIGYSIPESPNSADRRLRPGQSLPGDSDASMDMEETGVFGKIIGVDDTMSTISDQGGADDGNRTATYNFGDVSARNAADVGDQSEAQDDGDDDAMEMTVAVGGILSFPAVSPARPLSASTTSITKPSPASNSYARPTVASAQRSREPTPKAKRNIFGPSPGAATQPTTPRDGMTAAGDVAKRLSFGSFTSSIGKKRSVEDDQESQSGSIKKARPTIAQNIFAPKSNPSPAPSSLAYKSSGAASSSWSPIRTSSPPKAMTPSKRDLASKYPAFDTMEPISKPRDSLPRNLRPSKSPRKSAGTPLRLVAVEGEFDMGMPSPGRLGKPMRMSVTPQKARKMLMNSPGKSPALRRMLGEHVPEEEVDEAQDILDALGQENIPLSDFMRMAKVEFMEDLPKVKRKSTVARGLLGQPYTGGDREFGLHQYSEAEIHRVFLDIYRWAANTISNNISHSLEDIAKQEEVCSKEMPMVMREYLAAEEEDRVMFEQTFQTYKAFTVLTAREKWYDWKKDILESSTRPDLQALLDGAKEDAVRLEELEEQVGAVMPDLEARFLVLQEELEKERAIVQVIAECHQDELAGLKEAIAEQNLVINGQTSELEDANAKLATLQSKLNELSKTKAICENRINIAKSKCDQYTRSDILRFKEEYDSLQGLHLWHITSLRSDVLEMHYDDQLTLVVPCKEYVPDLVGSNVAWNKENLPSKNKQRYSEESSAGIFALVEDQFRSLRKTSQSLYQLVRNTGGLVLAAQRLRAELGVLNMRIPVTYRQVDTPKGRGLIVTPKLVLKRVKSKVELSFLLLGDVLLNWPVGLGDVEVEARTIYGSADPEVIKCAARDTIQEIRDEAYVGALTQAVFDALGQYDETR